MMGNSKKILGKISKVNYGRVSDYPFLFGLKLEFKLGDGSYIGDGSKYTINMSKSCRWETSSARREAIEEKMDHICELLEEAKVDDISDLVNIPVEVTITDGIFGDFRILTEVL